VTLDAHCVGPVPKTDDKAGLSSFHSFSPCPSKAMIARLPVAVALASVLFTTVSAQSQFQIFEPSGSFWWIAQSENLLVWDCKNSPYTNFTVSVANPNMASALAIIAQQPNATCSLLVTQDQMGALPVGNGYTVQLANPLNGSDIYSRSSAFEIKAAGSAYASTSVQPETASSTTSSSGSVNTGSSSSSSKSNDGSPLAVPMNYATAFVGAIVGVFML
jgi:hypothetical protein